MAQRAENGVQHRIQIPAEVFGEKPQHKIAALLQQLVFASVAPVRGPVGEMLRTIQLHCDARLRTKEIDLQVPCAIKRDGQLHVEAESPLRCWQRLEPLEEKRLRRAPRALGATGIGRHWPRHVNEETRQW